MLNILKNIVLFFLLVCAFPSNAQTNNFWYSPSNFNNTTIQFNSIGFQFDSKDTFLILNDVFDLSSNWNTFKTSFSTSDFNGKPLLYSDGEKMFRYPNIEVENSNILDSCRFTQSYKGHYLVHTDTANLIMLYHSYSTPSRFYRNKYHPEYSTGNIISTYIKKDNSTQSGYKIDSTNKNMCLFLNKPILRTTATRDSLGQPFFIVSTDEFIYSIRTLRNGILQKLDSFPIFISEGIADSVWLNPTLRVRYFSFPTVCNHSGSQIALNTSYEVITTSRSKTIQSKNTIYTLDLDKNTGKFSNKKILYNYEWNINMPPDSIGTIWRYFRNMVYTPNDSFIYVNSSNHQTTEHLHNLNTNYFDQIENKGIEIIRFKAHNNLTFVPIQKEERVSEVLVLTPNKSLFSSNSNMNWSVFRNIQSETPTRVEIQSDKYISSTPFFRASHLFDFIRIEQQLSYSCSASVRLRNTSLPDIGFTKFKWHIRDQNDSLLVFEQFEPPVLSFTQNGNYPIQLFAQSPKGGGYGEWYVDTIRVRIPNKPIANFASDTQVCQFLPLSFQNLSIDQTTHTPRPANYLWDFGDGNTSTLANPSHTYTRPGKFTVSLNFKNGYCDSTLSRELYIHVVDAPKPGFTVSDTFGCAPFQVSIGDTSWHNVQSKEYWFSDTAAWQNIPANNSLFYHTFTQPGYYKIVQKLLGLSGCEIRTDSVWINVAPGIKPNDSTHIHLATVQHPDVFVNWKSHPAAVSYTLLAGKTIQSLQPIATTSDTFYSHSTTEPLFYKVTASDSCQNQSTEGRYAYPAWLQGKILGNNDSAQLTLNSYAIWPASSIQYSLQKWNQEQWQSLQTQNSIFEYYDNNFVIKDSLRSCYRIEVSDAQLADLKAYSNILCLEYLPLIFIPNAFSPNGDGINDILDLNQTGIKSYNLQIYNRWGQKIFDGTNQGWNGQVNGTPASQGIYMVYLIYQTPDGQSYQKSGTVQLIR